MAKHFVATKLNAEKGEGKKVAERYGVNGFPTLVIVDSEGEELDRIIGYRPADKFLAELKPLTEGKSFGALKKRVAEKPSDLEAVLALGRKYEDRREFDKAEALYQRLLKAEEAAASLRNSAEGRLALVAFYKSRGKEVAAVEKYFEKNQDSPAAEDHANILFSYYQQDPEGKDQSAKVIRAAEYLMRHGAGTSAEFLNNYAWYLATHDKEIKKAIELAKKAVELSPKAPHIIDTLAEAYARNGMHAEAVETEKRAVELSAEKQRQQFETRLNEFKKALEGKKTEKTEKL